MQPGRIVIRTSRSLVGSVGTTVPICEMINVVLSRNLTTSPTIPPQTPMRRTSYHHSISAASMVSTEHVSTDVSIHIADFLTQASMTSRWQLLQTWNLYHSMIHSRNDDTCNCTSCATIEIAQLETSVALRQWPRFSAHHMHACCTPRLLLMDIAGLDPSDVTCVSSGYA